MMNTILLTCPPLLDVQPTDNSWVWSIWIGIFSLFIIYLLHIRIPINMAKKRRRDPLGWVLLSFVISPLIVYIILLCVGDDNHSRKE